MFHLAQYELSSAEAGAAAGLGIGIIIFYLAIIIFSIACGWKIFTKAGKPGWACIVPIYSAIVMLDIIGKPVWWIVLFFIPVANVVISIILCLELARVFGKGSGYAVGLILLPIVFYPMLAFGDAEYTAPTPA